MADDQKKVFDLTRAELGAKVRYEYDGDSVSVGVLNTVAQFPTFASISIDKTQHSVHDPEAIITVL